MNDEYSVIIPASTRKTLLCVSLKLDSHSISKLHLVQSVFEHRMLCFTLPCCFVTSIPLSPLVLLNSQCEHIPGLGFRRGSYKCVCREGYYFPDLSADDKFYRGSVVEHEYEKKRKVGKTRQK